MDTCRVTEAPTEGSTSGRRVVHRLPGPLDLEELAGLPPLRAGPGKLRRRTVPGQWAGIDWATDGVRPPYPGAGSASALHRDGRDCLLQTSWGASRDLDPHRPGSLCEEHTQASVLLLGRSSPPGKPDRVGGVRA